MYRLRCREKYSDEALAAIYAQPWPHGTNVQGKDHVLRLNATLKMAGRFINSEDTLGADLSCGDAYLSRHIPNVTWILGDFAPGYPIQGPIEETIYQISMVDVFLCCETLEHLDDPDSFLRALRYKTRKLIISTPICRWYDENPQHYWSWDTKAVKKMLIEAGFEPVDYEETYSDPGYCFQIFGAI